MPEAQSPLDAPLESTRNDCEDSDIRKSCISQMVFNDKNGFVSQTCAGKSVLPLDCVKVDLKDQIRESSVSTNLLQSNSRPTEKYPDSKPDRARGQTVKN